MASLLDFRMSEFGLNRPYVCLKYIRRFVDIVLTGLLACLLICYTKEHVKSLNLYETCM
jgi:hypothetical protein